MADQIIVRKRFCGPPASGNGGYTCGLVAKPLKATVEVRLHAPPPLDTPMALSINDNSAELKWDGKLVATATPAKWHMDVPALPGIEQAAQAERNYSGFVHHNLPTCFVCGPDRAAGDGLRIFAGQMAGDKGLFASTWKVDASLENVAGQIHPEFIWAALDCPGYFAVQKHAGFALLGAFSAQIERPVAVGETLVAVGWALASEGRKHRAGTALFDGDKTLVAKAMATWVSVPKEAYVAATQ